MSDTLRTNALAFGEAIVMGVAGTAPCYSIATTEAVLLATAGPASANALLLFALPTLGVAVALRRLGRNNGRAGATYDWVTPVFGRVAGFGCGWALMISSLVFLVSGALTMGSNLLHLFGDGDPGRWATLGVGLGGYVAIALVLVAGIGITSKVQLALTGLELAIMALILLGAAVHGIGHGAVRAPSIASLGFGYPAGSFAATALVVTFFYSGWDVTANLSEESAGNDRSRAGSGGVIGLLITVAIFVAFVFATDVLMTRADAIHDGVDIVFRLALAAGLGQTGARLAALAVVLSSVATMETSMLQFTRGLFAMARDRALPTGFGAVGARTRTPVRATVLLLVLGVVLIAGSGLVPTAATVMNDSVNAVGLQVTAYYVVAGLACAWVARSPRAGAGRWLLECVFPFASAVVLAILAAYAVTTFDALTALVGLGGLAIGYAFFRPRGWAPRALTPRAAVGSIRAR